MFFFKESTLFNPFFFSDNCALALLAVSVSCNEMVRLIAVMVPHQGAREGGGGKGKNGRNSVLGVVSPSLSSARCCSVCITWCPGLPLCLLASFYSQPFSSFPSPSTLLPLAGISVQRSASWYTTSSTKAPLPRASSPVRPH